MCARGYMRLVPHGKCVFFPGALSSCTDGVRSASEEGVDCGGVCPTPCDAGASSTTFMSRYRVVIAASSVGAVVCIGVVATLLYRAHSRQRQAERRAAKAGKDVAAGDRRARARSVLVVPWDENRASRDGAHKGRGDDAAVVGDGGGSDGVPRRFESRKGVGVARRSPAADNWLDSASPISPGNGLSVVLSETPSEMETQATAARKGGRSATYAPDLVGGRRTLFKAPGGRTRTQQHASSAVKPDTSGEPVFMPDNL
jgi:hypothetical protein